MVCRNLPRERKSMEIELFKQEVLNHIGRPEVTSSFAAAGDIQKNYMTEI